MKYVYLYICMGLAGAVLRPKALGNRLGILVYIFIAMDYYFFFIYISERSTFNLEKQKSIC